MKFLPGLHRDHSTAPVTWQSILLLAFLDLCCSDSLCWGLWLSLHRIWFAAKRLSPAWPGGKYSGAFYFHPFPRAVGSSPPAELCAGHTSLQTPTLGYVDQGIEWTLWSPLARLKDDLQDSTLQKSVPHQCSDLLQPDPLTPTGWRLTWLSVLTFRTRFTPALGT